MLAVAEIGLWLLLVVAGTHLVRVGLWAWARPLPEAPAGAADAFVTVMLPIRNERFVAERTIRAACALSWPRDRLEIQVLDDSDDETVALLDRLVAELAGEGHPIHLLRRTDRAGFKAGNLQNGLGSARGDLICILDADCIAPPDLLQRLVPPLLAEAKLGFTQARWTFENEAAGLLTRVQAAILDGLFLVEQSRLSEQGKPVPFDGTGGVWRRTALDAAGGFRVAGGSALTEDLDLSLRAELAGFRGRLLPEVTVATELPAGMAAFRAQQQRWVAGAGQVLRGLFRRTRAGVGSTLTTLAHLARHARQPFLALAALWLPFLVLGEIHALPDGAWMPTVAYAHLGFFVYLGAARRRRGRSPLAALLLAPAVVVLSMGLSLALSVAYVRGLLGRGGAFVRTPKSGKTDKRVYRAARDPLAFVEAAVGVAVLIAAIVAAERGAWLAGAALAVFVAAGFLWVGVGSLLDR